MITSKNIRLGVALAALLVLLCAAGCTVGVSSRYPPRARRPGPPPHAKAHGYRAKHCYRYYPSTFVYFDVHQGVYFYLNDGAWKTGACLPASITICTTEAVTIELDTDKPYTHFGEHKNKYPPGQAKKSAGQTKAAKPGKGHWK